MIHPLAVKLQFDPEPRVFSVPSLRIIEIAKGNDVSFTTIVFD